jgi:hypothetical protein
MLVDRKHGMRGNVHAKPSSIENHSCGAGGFFLPVAFLPQQ